jgi:hypothetical protein
LDRRLGGPQSWSGHNGGEEKNSQPLPGLELIIQLVDLRCTTELSRLLTYVIIISYYINMVFHLRGWARS